MKKNDIYLKEDGRYAKIDVIADNKIIEEHIITEAEAKAKKEQETKKEKKANDKGDEEKTDEKYVGTKPDDPSEDGEK